MELMGGTWSGARVDIGGCASGGARVGVWGGAWG